MWTHQYDCAQKGMWYSWNIELKLLLRNWNWQWLILYEHILNLSILFQSEMFQDDIFPPTASATPSLTADEWISGQNREPILISLKVKYYFINMLHIVMACIWSGTISWFIFVPKLMLLWEFWFDIRSLIWTHCTRCEAQNMFEKFTILAFWNFLGSLKLFTLNSSLPEFNRIAPYWIRPMVVLF